MKQHIVRFLHAGCLCLAVSLTSAFAQSSQLLKVDLPFAFEVNNQQFPAGQYKVSIEAGHPAVMLQNVKSKQSVYTVSSPIQGEKIREVASLVFTRYNDRYFLSKIWMTGTDSGRDLPPSRAERELVRSWARSAPKPDTKVVAALGPTK
jgi:hypothetical protein